MTSENALAVQQPVAIHLLTKEQKELIKRTVAKDATDDELAMFLHIAEASQLDPLRRQIHFMKYQGRVTIVADVNGLQARAAREPDYGGIDHAVVYEKDDFIVDNVSGEIVKHASNPFTAGKPIGAWAAVHRKGKRPFRSLVKFAEYDNSNNPLWKSKPSVMIDKVAKSTALRLAYPEQLGGIYDRAELDREEREINPPPSQQPAVNEPNKASVRTVEKNSADKLKADLRAQVEKTVGGKLEAKMVSTPLQRIRFAWLKSGRPESEMSEYVKNITGKTDKKALDDNDVGLVENALKADAEETDEPFSSETFVEGAA